MNLKWAKRFAIIFGVFYLLSYPAKAADSVNNGVLELFNVGESLSIFVNGLGSGTK